MTYARIIAKPYLVLTAVAMIVPGAFTKAAFADPMPTSSTSTVTQIVDSLLPEATVTVTASTTTPSASTLSIQIPPNLNPVANSSAAQQNATYAEIGWKTEMATAIAATVDPAINSYSLSSSDGSVPSAAYNYYHGYIRSPSATSMDPRLDSISQAEAVQQLTSNINVLTSGLPAGSIDSSVVKVLPIGSSVSQFALQANIVISDSSVVTGRAGDFLEGLDTGLTGSLTSSLIEGLAIDVTTETGA